MFRSLPLVPIDRFADIEAYSRLFAQGVDQVVVWGPTRRRHLRVTLRFLHGQDVMPLGV